MAANPGPRLGIQRSWGFILLAIWLIVEGLATIIGLRFEAFPIIMAIVAIIAGILILFGA